MKSLSKKSYDQFTGYDLYCKNQGEWKWLDFHQLYHSFTKNEHCDQKLISSFYDSKDSVYSYVTEMEKWLVQIKNNTQMVVPESNQSNTFKLLGMIDELLEEFEIIRNDRYKKEGVNNKDVPCNKTSRTLYNDTKKMDETTKKEFLEKNPDYPENSFYYFCLKCNCMQQFLLIMDIVMSWIENYMDSVIQLGDSEMKMSMNHFFFCKDTNPLKSLTLILSNYRIPIVCERPTDNNNDIHFHFKYTSINPDHPYHIRLRQMTERIVNCAVFEIQKNNDRDLFCKLLNCINQTTKHFATSKFKSQLFWSTQLFFNWCIIINEKLKNVSDQTKLITRVQLIMYQMFFMNSKSDSVHQFKTYSEWMTEYKPSERLFKDYILRKNVIKNDISSENMNLFSNNRTRFIQRAITMMDKTKDIEIVHRYIDKQQSYILQYEKANPVLSLLMKTEFYHYWFMCIHSINNEELQQKIFLILVYSETTDSHFVNIKESLKKNNIEMYDLIDISDIEKRWEKIVVGYYAKWVNQWEKYKSQMESKQISSTATVEVYHALFHFYVCCFMFQKHFWENLKSISQFPMIKSCYDYCHQNMENNEPLVLLLTNVFMLLNIK